MKKLTHILILLALCAGAVHAQDLSLSYYLPFEEGTFNPDIPTPEQALGYQVGEWHVSHDQLVQYMYALAAASDRILIERTGRTYENRPLLLLTISSPENLQHIEDIRQEHLAWTEGKSQKPLAEQPAILYQGYTIHGNEPSGANAALVMAYYLAASQDPGLEEMLRHVVILFDPCYNPDGMNRFASWVNTHKSLTPVSDPQSREFREAWPQGRTNHYWFDLNRDWLPVQHPESRARIANFHRWRPNVLTDHHEMGTNSTYFFQPGVPQRTNPLTPARNQELTGLIAQFHAHALDRLGSLYYSKERFDDFYYGKGSTFPDINGSIGILFEQASSRGHLQQSVHGELSFPFTIRNQVATSLSSLRATYELREELLQYQQDFFKEAAREAERDETQALLLAAPSDAGRMRAFLSILNMHNIKYLLPTEDLSVNGKAFPKGQSCLIPFRQSSYRLLRAMFDRQLDFQDSLFYDVSAWTLPLAFNLQSQPLDQKELSRIQEKFTENRFCHPPKPLPESRYAYLFSWSEYLAPRMLYALQKEGIRCKVAMRPFEDAEGRHFPRGSILVPVEGQSLSPTDLRNLLYALETQTGIPVYAMHSGNSPNGLQLGSTYFRPLEQPRVALIVGRGVTPYDAGEVWHLLDRRYHMPVTLLDISDMGRADLSRYDVFIMVNGSYGRMPSSAFAKLQTRLRQGATLITMRSASRWAARKDLSNAIIKKDENKDSLPPSRRPYEMQERDAGAQVIGGAIVQAQLDLSHPLCFGYENPTLPLLRRGTVFFKLTQNPYATPLVYSDTPLLAGYISDKNLKKMAGSPAVVVSSFGKGRVISFADNPNFRAFWYGSNKLFANALFFGKVIEEKTME